MALPCFSASALVGYTLPVVPHLNPPFTLRTGMSPQIS